MIARAAGTGMVSAAVLIASGCSGADAPRAEEKGAELRRASFRSFAAQDRLLRCGGERRADTAQQLQRFETLKDFARRRGPHAAGVLWRGENEWNAAARLGARQPCAGEQQRREALAEFSSSLDGLANGIMAYED